MKSLGSSLPRQLRRSDGRRLVFALALLLLGSGMHGCSADGDREGTSTGALTSTNSVTYWTQNNNKVPICFFMGYKGTDKTSSLQDSSFRQAFRCAIERTWGSATNLDFSGGWIVCPSPGTTHYMPVAITDGLGGEAPVGMIEGQTFIQAKDIAAWFTKGQGPFAGAGCNPASVPCAKPLADMRLMHNAAHEMGHVLGFVHEWENTTNRDDAGGILRYPDGGAVFCEAKPLGALTTITDLTAVDQGSIMQYDYCQRSMNGISTASAIGSPQGGAVLVGPTSDVFGVRKVYGLPNPGTADSDKDGWKDFEDNCPFVWNGLQTDSNRDAARTKAIQAGWNGNPNTSTAEGDKPQLADLQSTEGRYYIEHFRTWYKGDACDDTAVTANDLSATESHLDFAGCVQCLGGLPVAGTCPKFLSKGLMQLDSYLSSDTGLPWGDTGLTESFGHGSGKSRPAVCSCPFADSQNPTDRKKCQAAPYNCFFASDKDFPSLVTDDPNNLGSLWKRGTQEVVSNNNVWAPQFVKTDAEFGVPPYGQCPFTPLPSEGRWNPFHPWVDFQNNQLADVARLGLGLNATSLTGIVWTHVEEYTPKPPRADFGNSYRGLTHTIETGCVFKYVLNCPEPCLQWTPIGWFLDDPDPYRTGLTYWLAMQPDTTGSIAIALTANGATSVTNQFSSAALSQLDAVARGTRELLVADDNAVGRYEYISPHNALIVDPGSTTIRAALTKSVGTVSVQVAGGLPKPGPDPLRAYSAFNRQLYALEATSLVAHDVPSALAGNPSRASFTLSGAVPNDALAMAWVLGTNRLYVIDHLATKNAKKHWLRLVTIDVTSGACTELWRTHKMKTFPVTKAFVSMTAAGDALLSYNLDSGTYEAFVVRPDGQPVGSLHGTGSLHRGVLSDGAGFTVLKSQTMTETQPNVALTFTGRDALRTGICGTEWFRGVAGDRKNNLNKDKVKEEDDDEDVGRDKAPSLLGDPTFDCKP